MENDSTNQPPAKEPTLAGSPALPCSRIPTREDAPIVDSSWDFEDFDDEDDFADDDDNDDCGMFPCDGAWFCPQIGSEPCEFCPNRQLLGTPVDEDDDSEND